MSAINEVKLNDTLNRAWKDDKTGFGFRMLQKMGWKEDKGLGKNEEGIVDSVKVKRRGENEGLGTTKDQAGAGGWTKTVSGFSAVLEMLNNTKSHKDPKIKKLKKSKKKQENVQVRIKYNKMSTAKDFSLKTDAEKSSILGTKFNKDGDDEAEKKAKKSKKSKKEKKTDKDSESPSSKRKRSEGSSDDEVSNEKKVKKKKSKSSDA